MTGLHHDCIGIVDCDMIAPGLQWDGVFLLVMADRCSWGLLLDWIGLCWDIAVAATRGGRVWYQVLGCGTPWTPDAVRSRNPGAMEERGRPRNPCLVLYTPAVSVL